MALSKDKRKKNEEKISTEKERAIEAFKSFTAMEDIKITFAKEAFLEGFEICMRRVVKNFPEVDLDLLTDELGEEADPSDVGATSPATKPSLKASKPMATVFELAPKLGAANDVPTSSAAVLPEVQNF